MYEAPNSLIGYRVVHMNIITPTYTRGPGKATGSFALESAIDELAFKLNMDPIEFRLKNEPAKDPSNGKPWSSRKLVECLQVGAKAFGWEKRNAKPGRLQQGDWLVGYGVACGTYPAHQQASSAIIKLTREGNKIVAGIEMAAADLGTGTHTILAQTAADGLGLPIAQVRVKIGDSDLPPAAGSVGSVGATSYANAVNDACGKITDELLAKSGKQFLVRPTAAQLMESEKINAFPSTYRCKGAPGGERIFFAQFQRKFCRSMGKQVDRHGDG